MSSVYGCFGVENLGLKEKIKSKLAGSLFETMERVEKSANFCIHLAEHQETTVLELKCHHCGKSFNEIHKELEETLHKDSVSPSELFREAEE